MGTCFDVEGQKNREGEWAWTSATEWSRCSVKKGIHLVMRTEKSTGVKWVATRKRSLSSYGHLESEDTEYADDRSCNRESEHNRCILPTATVTSAYAVGRNRREILLVYFSSSSLGLLDHSFSFSDPFCTTNRTTPLAEGFCHAHFIFFIDWTWI